MAFDNNGYVIYLLLKMLQFVFFWWNILQNMLYGIKFLFFVIDKIVRRERGRDFDIDSKKMFW